MYSLETGELKVVFCEPASAMLPTRLRTPAEQDQVVEEAEEARRQRQIAAEAARQAEKPMPEPWDAWRSQKAPDMFEPEVTHRG